MNDSKWTWRSVSLISIAATVLLIVGFVYAVNDITNPAGDSPQTSLPQETATPLAGSTGLLKVVALGDSLAKGTGDNTGAGFVKRTVDGLVANGEQAELLGNMGINGQTTLGLQSSLKEEGVQYALRQANVIVLSIGGNDLFRGSDIIKSGSQGTSETEVLPDEPASTEAATAGSNGSSSTVSPEDKDLTPEALLAALPEAAKRLGFILESIAEINPQAQIYYVGLYNPFGDLTEMLVPGNLAVTAWNNAAMDIINNHSNMTLVPTFDLFNRHLDTYLSSDHFHPNGDGYQRMGERIIQAVR